MEIETEKTALIFTPLINFAPAQPGQEQLINVRLEVFLF